MIERLAVAGDDPLRAFVWWVEARRAMVKPPVAACVAVPLPASQAADAGVTGRARNLASVAQLSRRLPA